MARLKSSLAAVLVGLPVVAVAQMLPSVNMSGNTGLIDMPSGDVQPDGTLTLNTSRMGPIFRYAVAFQLTPRLSGTFRYVGIEKWNDQVCPPDCLGVNLFETYYDRNFDVSYQILTEGRYLPALSVGLLDFAGTGLNSAEYVAATKTFGDRVKLTAGLGFGRLGSFGGLGSPLGERPGTDVDQGGKLNGGQWFRGEAAPFAGVEVAVNEKWTAKLEYSSDVYQAESGDRGTFDRQSPWNFGVEYHPNRTFQFGAYYMYGDQVGVNFAITLDPSRRPGGALRGPAPYPVLARPPVSTNPEAWITGWTENPGINEVYLKALSDYLDRDIGLTVEKLDVTGDQVQVRYRSTSYDSPAQALGRVARALTHVMPASIEVFELVPLENGLPATKVTIYRSNLEKLDQQLGAGPALLVRSRIEEAGAPPPGLTANPDLYPKFTWSLEPTTTTRLFDPGDPIQLNLGIRAAASVEPAPGFVLSGALMQTLNDDISNPPNLIPSPLPAVRTTMSAYQVVRSPVIERLTAAYYARLAPSVYGRLTAGYLERMYGGVSAEMLYMPQDRPWALGAEANYVAQRNTDGMLGFDEFDYRTATGHVSGYFDLGKGYLARLDLGRYLAKDLGGTFTITRSFPNGWRMGAFATLTNVSPEDFGEGSFDKGVFVDIPINWLLGRPTRTVKSVTIRPVQRDGGARLSVNGRLYPLLRDYGTTALTSDWARVWK